MKKTYIQPVSNSIQLVTEQLIAASIVDRQDSIIDQPFEGGPDDTDSPDWGDDYWGN